MQETLYRKTLKGKKIMYVPVEQTEEQTMTMNLTEEECLTAAGSLGVTLLMIFERNMVKMKNGSPGLAERKIRVVKESILDLYRGTGKKINDDIALMMFRAWDKAMQLGEEGI